MTELFDDEFIARLPPLEEYAANPAVVACCKRTDPAGTRYREGIEAAFRALAEGIKPRFCERLRSSRDEAHLPAVYELLFLTDFAGRGWKVDYEPEWGGGTPDFIVHAQADSFVIEVTVMFDPPEVLSGRRKLETLQEVLASVPTRYTTELSVRGPLPDDLDHDAIVSAVCEWQAELPWRDDEDALYEFSLAPFGVDATVALCGPGYDDELPGRLVGTVTSGWRSIGEDRVKKAVHKKAGKYERGGNDPDFAFVVAVANETSEVLDDLDIHDALGGKETIEVPVNVPPEQRTLRLRRKRTGVFTARKPDRDEPVNTRVSAVGLCARREEGGGIGFSFRLVHNPFAARPLSRDVFADRPQLVPTSRDANGVRMEWTHGNDVVPLDPRT
jgi:hypothetical protein